MTITLKSFPWWLIAFGLLAGCLLIKLAEPPILTGMQLRVFDLYQRIKPRTYENFPVRIIDIDDASLAKIGQWPWPRTVLAELTRKLHAQGAAAIAYDIVFAEADRTSPAQILPLWNIPEAQRKKLGPLADHDERFAKVILGAPVVTGMVLTPTSDTPAKAHAGFVYAGSDPMPYLTQFSGAVTNIDAIEQAAKGNGALNNKPDFDGIVRRIPLIFAAGDALYPSLAAEALRVGQGASSYVIKSVGASGELGEGTSRAGVTDVKIGAFEVPTDAKGRFWVYFTKTMPERYVPARKILDGSADSTRINGNIVLLGTTAAGLKDLRATPIDPSVGGVEVHAQAIEQILAGVFLTRPDWIFGAEMLLIFVAGMLALITTTYLKSIPSTLFFLGILAAIIGMSWWGFSEKRLLIEPLTALTTVLLLYMVATVRRFVRTEVERGQIKNTFGLYLSPALVDELAKNPDKLELGGQNRNITVMFCDIRNFSAISEALEPEALTGLINRFLTPMTDAILASGGTIDKYIGDSIMAIWNAPLDTPDHPQRAAEAVLAMQEALAALNRELADDEQMNTAINLPIRIGVGVNTATCCVGNLGSNQRFEYSALGNGVDLASRLEGLSKQYALPHIISEATNAELADMATLELDRIQVKGKSKPVTIYTLIGEADVAHDADFLALKEAHSQLLTAYRAREWLAAKTQLTSCEQQIQATPTLQGLAAFYQLYHQRIEQFMATPPPQGWDGVFVATEK